MAMPHDQGLIRISRRNLLQVAGGTAALAAIGLGAHGAEDAKPAVGAAPAAEPPREGAPLKGRIKQSVCKWCFSKTPLDELCQAIQKMGLKGVDLLNPNDFPTLKKYGMVCTMVNSHGINKGFNRKENWDACIKTVRSAIEAAAEYGYPNVICFSGNRQGMDDKEGAANCVEGLKKIAPFAEEKKVTVCMELLNSKELKDYMCDSSDWAADVCKRIGSPRIKFLYDICHSATMGEDVIPTFQKHVEFIGHIHTGGYPGRHELDSTQKLDYPAIMKVIAESKFDGWVAQEFIPTGKDPLKSLAEAVKICDV
jgi:hydroxypyruvate isomerase